MIEIFKKIHEEGVGLVFPVLNYESILIGASKNNSTNTKIRYK